MNKIYIVVQIDWSYSEIICAFTDLDKAKKVARELSQEKESYQFYITELNVDELPSGAIDLGYFSKGKFNL